MENQINMGGQNTQRMRQNSSDQKQDIRGKPKINYLTIGLIVLVCSIIFGFGRYYLGKQSFVAKNLTRKQTSNQTGLTITTAQTQIANACVVEEDSILSIVENFETLQKNKDSKDVLALFTAPQQQDEISDYQHLSGKDNDIEPRLYNNVSTNFNTLSYKVIQQPTKSSKDSCIVQVEEQRSNYGGPTNPKYLPAQAMRFALTLRKANGEWKITQYQSLDPKIKKGKYSGFLMEYAYPTANAGTYVVWKTHLFPIQHESAFLGSKTINLEMKIPAEWTIWTSQVTTNPVNSMIKNCFISTIKSKDQLIKVTFAPICTGWSAKYSAWPSDAVIVLQQKRGGNVGPHNFFRVRFANSTNSYNYVDAMTEPNKTLDKTKDQIMDALLVGYAPPNESTDDFFFIPAHLTANYSGQVSTREVYLTIVDEIAASIILR